MIKARRSSTAAETSLRSGPTAGFQAINWDINNNEEEANTFLPTATSTPTQRKESNYASKLAEEVTRFYDDGVYQNDKENTDDENASSSSGKHFTKAMQRRETGKISLGVSFWAGYSNRFFIIECSGDDTTQTVLEKCIVQALKQQPPYQPQTGQALQLFTQTEFVRPQFKRALVSYCPGQPRQPKRRPNTLVQEKIKDGDCLHILPVHSWTNGKPKNMQAGAKAKAHT